MSAPDRIRVGFWSPVLNYVGGTETWHLTLLEQLEAHPRIELAGLAVLDESCCNPAVAGQVMLFTSVSSGARALADLARRVDVLVMWGIAYPGDLLDEDPARRPRTIFVCHGEASSVWQTASAEAAAPHIDRFVAVSEWARAGVPESKRAAAAVIPNGVDVHRLMPDVDRKTQRTNWGVPVGRRVLGFLGRCSPEKDPQALVRTVACLPDEWVGVCVGGGEDRNAVRADSFVYASGRVYFPGPTHDVANALNAFDVLLVPSREEGFCFAAVEAVIRGIPVVMTPVGVARDRPEWFVSIPVGANGTTLADAVLEAAHPEHAQSGALNRRQYEAAESFTPKAMGRRWADLLCEVARPS